MDHAVTTSVDSGAASNNGPSKLSEDEICSLLDKIHERTGKDNALIFYHRCQALLQETLDEDNFTIRDGYIQLRQHADYYCYALSLVIFMLEDKGSKEEVDTLQQYKESARSYNSDITCEHLNLWMMLTNLAAELSGEEEDVRALVSTVGYMTDTNTDHVIVQNQYSLATALKAFSHLEKKGKLDPTLESPSAELSLRDIICDHLHKKKLAQEYVDNFNPNQPISVDMLEGERKCCIS